MRRILPSSRLDKEVDRNTAYGTVWLGTGVNYTDRASGKEKAAKFESSSRDQLLVVNLVVMVIVPIIHPSFRRPS